MSSSVNQGNSSHASKFSRGNTEFGATNQRQDVSDKNSEVYRVPVSSGQYQEKESHNSEYGMQSEAERDQTSNHNQNSDQEAYARFSVKSTDMSENAVLLVVEKTILAFEAAAYRLETQKEGQSLDFNSEVAGYIKGEMELFYNKRDEPTSWHVIVGENYGAYFTHEEFSFIVYTFNNKWITVFKSNYPNKI